MDGVALLREAAAAGLSVRVEGDRLIVRGPKAAEPVARRLLAAKPAVVAALSGSKEPDGGATAQTAATAQPPAPSLVYSDAPMFGQVCAGWTPAGWRDRLRQLASRCRANRPDKAALYDEWADQLDIAIRPRRIVDRLPGDWQEWYFERAAIREYDGGQPREVAERAALRETLAAMRAAGEPPPTTP